MLAPLPVHVVPVRIQKAHISSYERNTFSLPELVSLRKPPISHLIENSEDLRAQFQSHSVKIQQLSLREEDLGWDVGGETTGWGPEWGGREFGRLVSSRTALSLPGACTPTPVPSLSPGNRPLAYFLFEAAGKDIFCSESVLSF